MALAEVDKAPFGWYHVRLAVVTGIGFFTDAYSVRTACAKRRLHLTEPLVIRHQPRSHHVRYSILAR
jgi:hypothetical protein